MPTDPIALINLSVAVQVSIVSGYLAYLIAYTGIRQHHTAADTVLKSFAFGLFATAIMKWGYQQPIFTPIVGLALSLVAGICWRWFGMKAWQSIVRNSGVSWSDDIPSAWLSITATDTKYRPSQVVVDIEGGRILMCDDTRPYANAPHGPCVFGADGGVALYVTSEYRDGEWITQDDVSHATQGDKITYIPASAVKRVEIRYWTEANGKASQAAVEGSESTAPVVEPEA